jgi:hypothetical protein
MKAQYLLRENIKALLNDRHEDQTTLARWLSHEKSWLNKILNGHRDMQIEDFDKVADFFGIATYQLFQPGIASITERRKGKDRRGGRERRISHVQHQRASLTDHINQLRQHRQTDRPDRAANSSDKMKR